MFPRSALPLLALSCLSTSLATLPGTVRPARADTSAAHALAQKFAAESEAEKAKLEAARKAEEAEMLESARREAEERQAEARRQDAEKEAAARRAAEASAAEAATKKAVAEAAEAEKLRQEMATKRQAEEQRLAEDARKAEADRQAMAMAREEEARRLSDKLRQVREKRVERGMGLGGEPERDEAPAEDRQASDELQDDAPAAGSDQRTLRVTVLLAMQPGDRGIRRFNKTADPVVCLGTVCFVSRGPAAPASKLTRADALGPINTLGRRAGNCRMSLTCVYRGIRLDVADNALQPVDLHYLRHDRRQPRAIAADATCMLDAGRLMCRETISGDGWRAWIVPEKVAREAGPDLLLAALASGLPQSYAAVQQSAGRLR